MRHPKYFIVHCLLYKVTFKGYNIVHNLATTNLNSVPISLLIVTKCDLGQEKKNAGATAGYLDNRNKFHLTRTSKHQVKSTEEDLRV